MDMALVLKDILYTRFTGHVLVLYFIYQHYCFTTGVVSSFRERFYLAKQRFNGLHRFIISFFTILFLSIGGYIYYENNILNIRKSSKEREVATVEWEKSIKNMKITFNQELHR